MPPKSSITPTSTPAKYRKRRPFIAIPPYL
jgi:hypothetical protein